MKILDIRPIEGGGTKKKIKQPQTKQSQVPAPEAQPPQVPAPVPVPVPVPAPLNWPKGIFSKDLPIYIRQKTSNFRVTDAVTKPIAYFMELDIARIPVAEAEKIEGIFNSIWNEKIAPFVEKWKGITVQEQGFPYLTLLLNEISVDDVQILASLFAKYYNTITKDHWANEIVSSIAKMNSVIQLLSFVISGKEAKHALYSKQFDRYAQLLSPSSFHTGMPVNDINYKLIGVSVFLVTSSDLELFATAPQKYFWVAHYAQTQSTVKTEDEITKLATVDGAILEPTKDSIKTFEAIITHELAAKKQEGLSLRESASKQSQEAEQRTVNYNAIIGKFPSDLQPKIQSNIPIARYDLLDQIHENLIKYLEQFLIAKLIFDANASQMQGSKLHDVISHNIDVKKFYDQIKQNSNVDELARMKSSSPIGAWEKIRNEIIDVVIAQQTHERDASIIAKTPDVILKQIADMPDGPTTYANKNQELVDLTADLKKIKQLAISTIKITKGQFGYSTLIFPLIIIIIIMALILLFQLSGVALAIFLSWKANANIKSQTARALWALIPGTLGWPYVLFWLVSYGM